ncbi:MAG: outer membrane beta-barrel protein [Holophagaceae bacterium]|jgi:opacity protein-like surface antigen|nr:outer membrane beta-barrel protein [Holophagaceae bacterium]
MKTLTYLATVLSITLVATTSTLGADEGQNGGLKTYLAGGFTFAQGDSRDLTQATYNINNWSAEIGIEVYSPFAEIHLRPNFGMAKMYGVEKPETWNWPTYQMLGWYVGCDLVYKNPRGLPVSLTSGPSFHIWNVEEMYTSGNSNQSSMNLKFGWRAGVNYEVNEKWAVELSYTLTEWRSVQGQPHQPGLNPSRPLYFNLKGIYTF